MALRFGCSLETVAKHACLTQRIVTHIGFRDHIHTEQSEESVSLKPLDLQFYVEL